MLPKKVIKTGYDAYLSAITNRLVCAFWQPRQILQVFHELHFCRGDRTRTCDPMLPKHVRYQLRYTPNYLPVPNHSVPVSREDFPGSTPVIPLSATLHVLYLELMTSSYTYSYYLLRFTPQHFSNLLSSFREYWVSHDVSLSALSSVRFHIVL